MAVLVYSCLFWWASNACAPLLHCLIAHLYTHGCAGTKYNFAKLWKDYAAYGNIEEV
jgi:hypothetical protein